MGFRGKLLLGVMGILIASIAYLYYNNVYLKGKIYDQAVLSAQNPPDYKLVFVGDSMTQYLGNFDELRNYLAKSYPGKNFLLLNYGFGSTNILSIEDRLTKESSFSGRVFAPINEIDFDLILIESMGHNPLSSLPLEEGLKKQTEALDRIVEIITEKHPKESIVFIATIAPNLEQYAQNTVVLDDEQRKKWVNERRAYIENHISYAKSRGIPIINIYEKSQDLFGSGKLDYVNTTDFIHPSPTGIYFISEEIAKFIKENNLVK